MKQISAPRPASPAPASPADLFDVGNAHKRKRPVATPASRQRRMPYQHALAALILVVALALVAAFGLAAGQWLDTWRAWLGSISPPYR